MILQMHSKIKKEIKGSDMPLKYEFGNNFALDILSSAIWSFKF